MTRLLVRKATPRPRARRLAMLLSPVALIALLTIGASACSATAAPKAAVKVLPCATSQLSATFSLIPGSQGAGNLVYALRLLNPKALTCTVSGVPQLQLLNANRVAQQTHDISSGRGTRTTVVLAKGASAWATARFSPDVPGVGEGNRKICESTSYYAQIMVAPSRSITTAKISPPTPVCEHGQLQLSYFGPTKPTD